MCSTRGHSLDNKILNFHENPSLAGFQIPTRRIFGLKVGLKWHVTSWNQLPHVEGGKIFRHLIFWTQLHLNRKKETWRMTQPKGISPKKNLWPEDGIDWDSPLDREGCGFLIGQGQLSYVTKYTLDILDLPPHSGFQSPPGWHDIFRIGNPYKPLLATIASWVGGRSNKYL